MDKSDSKSLKTLNKSKRKGGGPRQAVQLCIEFPPHMPPVQQMTIFDAIQEAEAKGQQKEAADNARQ